MSYRLAFRPEGFFLEDFLEMSGSPMAASTTERASCIGSAGFLLGDFFLGRALDFTLGVRFLVVRLLAFTRVFLKDSNVPFMPACVIDKAFRKSSRIFFMAMPHHAIAESESH